MREKCLTVCYNYVLEKILDEVLAQESNFWGYVSSRTSGAWEIHGTSI